MSKERIDGYLQTKERELNEKFQQLEIKQKLLDQKASAMERQIERYQTVLDDIKKQSNEKKELFDEIKFFVEGVNKEDKKQIQRQLIHFKKDATKMYGVTSSTSLRTEKYVDDFSKNVSMHLDVIKQMRAVLHNLLFDKGLISENEHNFLAITNVIILDALIADKKVRLSDIIYDKKINYTKQSDREVSRMSKKEKDMLSFYKTKGE